MQQHYSITTEPHPAERYVTLLLIGKFGEDALADLERTISTARGARQSVHIDLSEVTLVDRKAVQYLSRQARHGVKLMNCPIYLRRWIGQVSDEVEN